MGFKSEPEASERKYVILKLQEEFPYTLGNCEKLDEDNCELDADDILNCAEDIREYMTVCFFDHDFALLDNMTTEDLIEFDKEQHLGIF